MVTAAGGAGRAGEGTGVDVDELITLGFFFCLAGAVNHHTVLGSTVLRYTLDPAIRKTHIAHKNTGASATPHCIYPQDSDAIIYAGYGTYTLNQTGNAFLLGIRTTKIASTPLVN